MSRTYKKNNDWQVPSWFKRMNRREERTKEKQALREDKELPKFKKRDKYEYW